MQCRSDVVYTDKEYDEMQWRRTDYGVYIYKEQYVGVMPRIGWVCGIQVYLPRWVDIYSW